MPQPASPSSASSSVKTAGTEGESKGKKTFASRKQGEDYNLNWFLYETFEGSNHCVYITEGLRLWPRRLSCRNQHINQGISIQNQHINQGISIRNQPTNQGFSIQNQHINQGISIQNRIIRMVNDAMRITLAIVLISTPYLPHSKKQNKYCLLPARIITTPRWKTWPPQYLQYCSFPYTTNLFKTLYNK